MWIDYIEIDESQKIIHNTTDTFLELIARVRAKGFDYEIRVPVDANVGEFFNQENKMIDAVDENGIHKFDQWTSYLREDETGYYFICLFRSAIDAVLAKLILL